jgi:hypothetical protein
MKYFTFSKEAGTAYTISTTSRPTMGKILLYATSTRQNLGSQRPKCWHSNVQHQVLAFVEDANI